MIRALDAHVVLLGMMGSGKTTVGLALSERTGLPYVDNDAEVRAMTEVAPHELFATDGEASLHEAEAAALLEALAGDRPTIIGAAAWVVLDPACREALEREQHVCYLRARPETLLGRIGTGSGRRSDATDAAWLRRRSGERDAIYRSLATITLDTDELAAEAVADTLLGALSAPHARSAR